jgi:hypothetical protein
MDSVFHNFPLHIRSTYVVKELVVVTVRLVKEALGDAGHDLPVAENAIRLLDRI